MDITLDGFDIHRLEEISYELNGNHGFKKTEIEHTILLKALYFLDVETYKRINDEIYFVNSGKESAYYHKKFIKGRSVIVINSTDLQEPKKGIPMILHEISHHLLNHIPPMSRRKRTENEREAWLKVKELLPSPYHEYPDIQIKEIDV